VTRALILGVTGQDGSYLAEQLLADGYEVWGVVRRPRPWPLGVRLLPGDLLDQTSLEDALRAARPDEVYNLAAVTAPGAGWGAAQPPLLADVTGLGVLRLLDAVARVAPDARVVHASSSAVYDPRRYGLYGISKQFAHDAVVGYRGRLHCSNAVLFSHTSPRQDARFLARRIAIRVVELAAGDPGQLVLGDVANLRDWGYAPEYTRALPLIAGQDRPGDYVIATGRRHSVREMAEAALAAAGLDWSRVTVDSDAPLVTDEQPADNHGRLAAARALGWKPEVGLAELMRHLVEAQT
jgi:GDPmannose 4,6-dehydratase